MNKKRVLSLIQPTGEMHIGNYFGAIKNWVDIQDRYDCVYGVADLHAMTMPYDPHKLRGNTTQMFIDLMACGIDPAKSVLFVQSLVPQHTELTWIFNCVTSYGELSRMTQFKDKTDLLEEKGAIRVLYPPDCSPILFCRRQIFSFTRPISCRLERTRNNTSNYRETLL